MKNRYEPTTNPWKKWWIILQICTDVNVNASYEIDSLNLLNVQLGSNFANNKTKDFLDSNFYQQNILAENNNSNNNFDSNRKGFEASANYQIGFKNDKNQLLTLSYRFNNYDY